MITIRPYIHVYRRNGLKPDYIGATLRQARQPGQAAANCSISAEQESCSAQSGYMRSKIAAMPCPPPMHMVTSA